MTILFYDSICKVDDPSNLKYFYVEALPKIVRAVLTRKYSINKIEQVTEARAFLQHTATKVGQVLGREDVASVLLDLLNPNMPFYQSEMNICTLTAEKDPASNSSDSQDDIIWMYSLKRGDLLDVLDTKKIWMQSCILEVRMGDPNGNIRQNTGKA